jgi:hypothetical protein
MDQGTVALADTLYMSSVNQTFSATLGHLYSAENVFHSFVRYPKALMSLFLSRSFLVFFVGFLVDRSHFFAAANLQFVRSSTAHFTFVFQGNSCSE